MVCIVHLNKLCLYGDQTDTQTLQNKISHVSFILSQSCGSTAHSVHLSLLTHTVQFMNDDVNHLKDHNQTHKIIQDQD